MGRTKGNKDMFEKISGFFKRFSRRRKRQSGETTIMNGKEPGLDEFGLDEGFGDMGDLEESIDKVGTAPAGAESKPGMEPPFSDADFQTGEEDFSTGASDFDERTISDEISGSGLGVAEAGAEAPGAFPGEAEAPPFLEAAEEPEPASPTKRILTLAIVAVIAIIVGAVAQVFVWPVLGKLMGASGTDQPALDIQTQVNAARRENEKLKSEVNEFVGMGKPAEVKALQQQLAQARDSQGPMEEFQTEYNLAQERGAAYDALVAKIDEVETGISETRADIREVKAQIADARVRVAALAEQTEEEYARFQLELVRAELSQRLLIELQMQDIESFQEQLAELDRQLSRLTPAVSPATPSEAAPE